MKKKFFSIITAIAIMFGLQIAVAPTASANNAPCAQFCYSYPGPSPTITPGCSPSLGNGSEAIWWGTGRDIRTYNQTFCLHGSTIVNRHLVWQTDGNLVMYEGAGLNVSDYGYHGRALWSSGTNGRGYSLEFQPSGRVVIHQTSNTGPIIWSCAYDLGGTGKATFEYRWKLLNQSFHEYRIIHSNPPATTDIGACANF